MNGSRVNPNAKKDPFQDYDIVYYVRSVEPFRRNMDVVRYFGEIMILQTPEDMSRSAGGRRWALHLPDAIPGRKPHRSEFLRAESVDVTTQDSLSLVLLDKDNLLGELPPPSDVSYLPRSRLPRPSTIAAMNSGGSIRMSPKACGAMN